MEAVSEMSRGTSVPYSLILVTGLGIGSLCPAQFWQEVPLEAPVEVTANARFGSSLSLEGDWLLVGAPGTDAGAPGSGAAYLYKRNLEGPNTWGLVQRLLPPVPFTTGGFGTDVILREGTVYISAPRERVQGVTRGAIHRFDVVDIGTELQWAHAQIIASDTAQWDLRTGEHLAAHDDQLIALGRGYDNAPGDQVPGAGALLGFVHNATEGFEGSRTIPGNLLSPTFERPSLNGWFDAVDGMLVYTTAGSKAFAIDLAALRDASVPVPTPTPVLLTDSFGFAGQPVLFTNGTVGSDGRLLLGGLVGFPFPYPIVVSFDRLDGQFVQEGHMLPDTVPPVDDPRYWLWGASLDHHGERTVVGDPGDIVFTPLGYAEVFERDSGASGGWRSIARLLPIDPENGALFGAEVQVGDGVVVVGAPGHGTQDRGKVYVFLDPTVGSREDAQRSVTAIEVFPVPASVHHQASVWVSLPDLAGWLHVHSSEGRQVGSHRVIGSRSLDIVDLSPGQYTLTFDPDDNSVRPFSGKLVVLP